MKLRALLVCGASLRRCSLRHRGGGAQGPASGPHSAALRSGPRLCATLRPCAPPPRRRRASASQRRTAHEENTCSITRSKTNARALHRQDAREWRHLGRPRARLDLPQRERMRERACGIVPLNAFDVGPTRPTRRDDRRRHGCRRVGGKRPRCNRAGLGAASGYPRAARLIAAGKAARRVLGRHPLYDLPAQVGDDRFDTSAFEAMAEARRDRVRRAA